MEWVGKQKQVSKIVFKKILRLFKQSKYKEITMSKFIEAIEIYRKYGFDIRSGLNPYHFNNQQPLALPFTCLRKLNEKYIISTGGGDFTC